MGIYEPGGCSEPGAASQVRTTQGAAAGRRHDGWVCVCVCVFCRAGTQNLEKSRGQVIKSPMCYTGEFELCPEGCVGMLLIRRGK